MSPATFHSVPGEDALTPCVVSGERDESPQADEQQRSVGPTRTTTNFTCCACSSPICLDNSETRIKIIKTVRSDSDNLAQHQLPVAGWCLTVTGCYNNCGCIQSRLPPVVWLYWGEREQITRQCALPPGNGSHTKTVGQVCTSGSAQCPPIELSPP